MRCLIASALFRYSSAFVFKRVLDFSFVSAVDEDEGKEKRQVVGGPSGTTKYQYVHTILGRHEIVQSSHVLGIRFSVVMVIFRVNGMRKELEGGLHRV